MILHKDHLVSLTREFLALKRQFNPGIPVRYEMDIARHEVKGADLRRDIRKGTRNARRYVQGFVDKVIALLETHGVRFVSRIYIKKPGVIFDGRATYTASVQGIFESFQEFLSEHKSLGFVVADSRTPHLNSIVSHSIFTQKFRAKGDPYNLILEMPVFGHSENHAMLQIADFISSTLLYPIATNVYCAGHVKSVHVHPKDKLIKERYALRLRKMTYRYFDGKRTKGGITIVDAISKLGPQKIFEDM